jgi:hypothetical protein
MRKSKYTDEQIISILKEADAGAVGRCTDISSIQPQPINP